MKTKSGMRRGFTLVELLVVIVIIAALAGLTAPMLLKQGRKADLAEATSNARQIGMALFAFQADYNSYPGANTETEVDNTGTYTLNTTTSNGCFGQLFAGGFTESETMFFAKVKGSKKSDGNITGAKALAEGECGFGYVLNDTDGQTISGNSSRILAMSPLLDGDTDFDPDPFDKKAIHLRIDNSVTSGPIKTGKAMSSTKADAVDLFDAAVEGSMWGDVKPKLLFPLSGSTTTP